MKNNTLYIKPLISDKGSGNCNKVLIKPYLNTSTSKQVEYTKAFEWTILKELGKMTTVTSGEGGPLLILKNTIYIVLGSS